MATASLEHGSKSSALQNLKHDLPASLVVFLVALPLSLGIAIASGAPLMAGLIAAVVGGIVAGLIGGSPLQVTGPAAGLTVVVAGLIDQFGWGMTCVVTVAAGVLQILFGLSRIARTALAIAPVVVHAMLAGIGITIALQQIHVLMGGASRSTAWENLAALPHGILNHHLPDVIIGVIVIAILLLWPKLPARLRVIPGALVAIVVGTAVAVVAKLPAERIDLQGKGFFDSVGLPDVAAAAGDGSPWSAHIGALVLAALTVALIASVESLLSAVGVDKLHTGPRSNFDREMIGQGSANVVSGVLSGLPVTGVIVRSSTNVNAGARTRWSAVLHGVWILLFASMLTDLVELVPKAALAGLLIVIGMQLVKLVQIRMARRTGDLAVYLITVVCVVFLNLLEGVAIGLAVSIVILLWRVMRAHMEARPAEFGNDADDNEDWHVELDGTLSFLSLPRLTRILGELPNGSRVTITINADYVDHAISETIADWKRAHEATGGTVLIIESSHAKLHHAHAAPPKRHYGTRAVGLVPWRSWLASYRDEGGSVLDGIDEYNRRGRGVLSPHIAELTEDQNPDALFLTCADSRILPNVITASGPGDLFTVRNVGNLVVNDGTDESMDAALDFAASKLGVSSIVVCGHSSCGAMTALIDNDDEAPNPVSHWLAHAHDSVTAYHDGHPARATAAERGFGETDQLGVVNVAIQVGRLIAHPVLTEAVAEGRIEVVGVFFDLNTAHVYQVDELGITENRLASPVHS